MNKKKVGIIIAAVVVAAAAAGGGIWYFLRENGGGGNSADKVYVESVKSLTTALSSTQNRYSGVVEPQESWEVNKNGEKEVKEVLVKEGDKVEAGTPLFQYNTEDITAELEQAKLDLEGMQNEISDSQAQINQLTEEKNAAPEEDKYEYTAGIQNLQNEIKQKEYSIESKKIEMQKKQESIDNSTVTSEIAGVVKSINESGTDAMTGEEAAYMTILATGDYRIKGTVSELNMAMLSVEQPVIIRSRIDEEQTWKGTINKIDTDNQITSNSNGYSESGDQTQTATKYPFYVTLEGTDGLILGQHVYIELNEGQTEKKEGIWLNEGYIVKEKKETYIWTAGKRDKLEKRKVKLGEYDEGLGEYEIVSGLTEEDCIAYPMEGFHEGITTVKDASEVDYSSPLYNQGQEGQGDSEGEPAENGGTEAGLPEGTEVPSEGEGFPEGEMDGMEEAASQEEGTDDSGESEPADGKTEIQMQNGGGAQTDGTEEEPEG